MKYEIYDQVTDAVIATANGLSWALHLCQLLSHAHRNHYLYRMARA